MIPRSSCFEFTPGIELLTVPAEDLVEMRALDERAGLGRRGRKYFSERESGFWTDSSRILSVRLTKASK